MINKKIVFFDLETQNLSTDVGGWQNKHLLKMSIGVIFLSEKNEFKVFTEEKIDALIEEFKNAELVVGFNIKNFDFEVLQPYTEFNLKTLPVFDILEMVHTELGFRLSLDNLASTTLSNGKSGNGILAVEWFRKGQIDKVIEYCKDDVIATKELFEFGVNNGYLLYKNRNNEIQKVKFRSN